MAHTNSWDETIPTNSTNAVDIDDHIRKVRLDVRERMAVDHDISSSDSGEAEIGIHKKVTLKAEISAPTPSQNGQSIIYRNSSDNDRELRHAVKDANGTVVQDKIVFVGEIKFWLGLEANIPTGWLPLKGSTVGTTGSGATYAGPVYQDLYYHLWNNLDNTAAPVSSGRGASAAADFTALKTITMPDGRSKMPIGAGQASGMTLRKEGYTGGGETKNLGHVHGMSDHTHNMLSHTHTLANYGSPWNDAHDGTKTLKDSNGALRAAGTGAGSQSYQQSATTGGPSTASVGTPSTPNTGSGLTTTEDVMNPWVAIWMIIKY